MLKGAAKLPVLLALALAAAFALASCSGQGSGGSEGGGHEGMGHGGGMSAEEMLMPDGEYSDEIFIDQMVPHHHGAVEMSEVALGQADHPELKQLSRDIISEQRKEIHQFRDIKEQQFGTREVPMEMSEEHERAMGMVDPEELAGQRPFDRAFIDAMIPHHRSAIEMARVALDQSDNEEIRSLARNIVESQKREISQMKDWREEWYAEQ